MFSIKRFVPVKDVWSTVGMATVATPAGVIFHDVAIHERNGVYFAVPGRRPVLTEKGGCQKRDEQDRPLWAPVVSFASTEIRDRFSNAVLEALRRSNPEAFQLRAPQEVGGAE